MDDALPAASKQKYKKTYDDFLAWRTKNVVVEITEDVMIRYFSKFSETLAPTSLWAYHSMLKCTLKLNENFDISGYRRLTEFLKTKSIGYKPVQASVFSKEHIDKFIDTAPDKEWLDVKVACILGICGRLKTEELTNIRVKDIQKHGDLYLVHVARTKKNNLRSFTVGGKFCAVVEKYASLRSERSIDPRFFVNYQHGKCTIQVIGRNKFSKMPERIARFLNLPEPQRFTGLSFRRSSLESDIRNCEWDSIRTNGEYNDDHKELLPPIAGTSDSAASSIEPNLTIKMEPPSLIGFQPTVTNHTIKIESPRTIIKSEPFDPEVTNETNSFGAALISRQHIGNRSDGTKRMYKCEQCGHMNAITPSLQDGFIDSSESIENTSVFRVSIDPLSMELTSDPLQL